MSRFNPVVVQRVLLGLQLAGQVALWFSLGGVLGVALVEWVVIPVLAGGGDG
jgi:hypothetical protein